MSLPLNTLIAAMLAGSGVSLPQVGSIVSQFSADAIPAQGDNTNLSSWTDSITGLAVSQATGANQPKYRVNRLGTKPSVQFGGTQWLAGAIPALKTAVDAKVYTVLIASNNALATSWGGLFGNSAGGTGYFFFCRNGTTLAQFNGDVTTFAVTDPSPSSFATLAVTGSGVAQYPGAQSGSSLTRLGVNGMYLSSTQPTSSNLATSSADGQFAIGAANSAGQLAGKADIYEVIIWNRILTQVELLQAEIWMRTKYGQALPWAGATSIDVYDGDSIMDGVGTFTTMGAIPYLVSQSRGKALGQWCNQAVGGMTTTGMTAKLAEWTGIAALTGKPVRVAAFEWYNEHLAGKTYTVVASDMVAYCANVRATANTTLCLSSSTSYNTDATDYLTSTGRKGYNDYLDANFASMCDSYAPLHNDTNIGTYDAYTNHPTNWGDGVHPTPTARSTYMAPIFLTGMNALGA